MSCRLPSCVWDEKKRRAMASEARHFSSRFARQFFFFAPYPGACFVYCHFTWLGVLCIYLYIMCAAFIGQRYYKMAAFSASGISSVWSFSFRCEADEFSFCYCHCTGKDNSSRRTCSRLWKGRQFSKVLIKISCGRVVRAGAAAGFRWPCLSMARPE